jgi:hypothetical protein
VSLPASDDGTEKVTRHGFGTASDSEHLASLISLLAGLPPFDGFRNVRSLAEWGVEAVVEAMPFVGIFALLLVLRAGTTRIVDRSSSVTTEP